MLMLAVPVREGMTPEEIAALTIAALKRMDDMIATTLHGLSEPEQRVVRTLLMWGQAEATQSYDAKLAIMNRCLVNLLDVIEKQLGGNKEESWREGQRKCHDALEQLQAQIEKEHQHGGDKAVH